MRLCRNILTSVRTVSVCWVMPTSLRSQKHPRVPSQDGRSADARLMRRTRAELIRHVGGKPTATQAAIVDQIAWLTLYVTRMNRQALETGGVHSDHAAKQFLAYQNSLTRALARLGLDAVPPPKDTRPLWQQLSDPPVGQVAA